MSMAGEEVSKKGMEYEGRKQWEKVVMVVARLGEVRGLLSFFLLGKRKVT